MDPNQVVSGAQAKLTQAVERFKDTLKSLRTGRASASMLDGVMVEAYGTAMPLIQVQAAQIIGRDPLPWFGTVIINKGDADGVHKNMAVLSPFGVVGQTIATSAHSARVLLITDHNSGVDAVVQRSRARGIIEGALDGRCVMKYLKRGEDVEVDDRVVTSGLDGIFPKGIIVGTITHVTRGNRGLLQVADVKASVPLDRIEEVLVVPSDTRLKDVRS